METIEDKITYLGKQCSGLSMLLFLNRKFNKKNPEKYHFSLNDLFRYAKVSIRVLDAYEINTYGHAPEDRYAICRKGVGILKKIAKKYGIDENELHPDLLIEGSKLAASDGFFQLLTNCCDEDTRADLLKGRAIADEMVEIKKYIKSL